MEMNSSSVAGSPQIMILDLDGELDASNYLDVIDTVRRLYKEGARQLVLDLSDLKFLSSSGLVSLHSAALIMRGEEPPNPELGWSAFHSIAADVEQGFETCCTLVNPQGRVRKTLEMTGFNTFLRIFDDTDAAVRSFSAA
ncbi:putative Anti-sigma factor antagonist [Candidatus Promineifilum breve]|uniref:Anti-sigma factor antagonist n=1 Tax=Candidatus Promineifilum breve TaxID=1806508 RepID=A0A170PFE1_9CHLR|nr:STAS domain-containing protein [Candidatus Promineifilum breve]CUS03137.2 putative Anti-sigma factor antagonist [Candidatus Promineifilum breve]